MDRIPTVQIYVDVAGQDDNLGDSVLRRGLLDALRVPGGQLHIHTGDNSASYVAGLNLTETDVEYSSRPEWRTSLMKQTLRERTHIAIDPGEIRSDVDMNFASPRVILASAVVRARGGAVIHSGIGLRATTRPRDGGTRVLAALSSITTWRDSESRQRGRFGRVVPDWAFGTGSDQASDARPYISVTMRGDRDAPDAEWISGVKRLREKLGLVPVLYAQVRRDNELSKWLHEQIPGSELMQWKDDTSHRVREREVRDLLRRSQCVVSDRVHALIVGATEGAVPIGFARANPEKLTRTLEAGGLTGFTFVPEPSAVDRMVSAARRSEEVRAAVTKSRADLRDLTAEIHRSLGVNR